MADKSIFEKLSALNVNKNKEDRNGLSYLSWTWAWSEFKKACPDANYEVVKFDGLPYCYDPNTGYMVYTRVTVGETTHEMWLPVMDSSNHAMKAEQYTVHTKYKDVTVEAATMFDVNKAIMRCLTKNLAMFGLGLYIYAGEDLPEEEQKAAEEQQRAADEQARQVAIDTLKKTGTEAQIKYYEKKLKKSIDQFTFEEADGATKQIIVTEAKRKNDGKSGGS